MKTKILGIFIVTLLIATAVLPVAGIGEESNADVGQNNPPLVVIEYPSNGTTFSAPHIVLTGYATGDLEIVTIGSHHEWTGGDATTDGNIVPTTYCPFTWNFWLHEGWNRITIFAYDVIDSIGEDQITVYYYDTEPPNKPACSYDSISDKLSITATDPDGDQVRYGVDWDKDWTVDQWTTLVPSGTQQSISCGGRKDTVGVIAEDEHGAQSDWASVTPKNKPYINTPFLNFLEQHPYMFPLLRQLFRL